ncbi:MAG: hypothetical protein ACOC33_03400, partial [bacterium]
MRLYRTYGSKDRVYNILRKIDENFLPPEEKNELFKEFLEFCYSFLEINGEEEPKIVISYDDNEAAD